MTSNGHEFSIVAARQRQAAWGGNNAKLDFGGARKRMES